MPPANLTDATPSPPTVINGTERAVTDADAQTWATAQNRGSVWYRWAEANNQPGLLPHLGVLKLDPPAELQALAAGDAIAQPDCSIFPNRLVILPVDASALHFFGSLGESVRAHYVFVATFPGPCTITATARDGQVRVLASYPTSGVTFFAGEIRNDAALGDLWFVEGAGNCGDRGAPTTWCS